RAHDDALGDRAWAYRNFRILLLGQAVSSLGNTLVPVCLAFAVLALTHRASDLGAVLGCEAGAIVVFLLPAGVLADRWSRRATMVASDALRGVSQAALGLLFVTGHPPLGLVAALAAASGAGIALYYPAVSGLVPSLVGPGALQRANALQQTVVAAAGVAGPALAGVLVVGVGAGWGLVVDAGTFGVSILTLVTLRLEAAPGAGSGRFAADLWEGWADFWSRAWFRDVVIGASVYNFLYAGYTVLGPVVSERHYGGAAAWAAAATVTGVGSVVSAPLVARMRPR
ncbi:MFS transporter, partial [Acidimicrobiaceae bacterium USS-CC1]|nr:MFS transporter [Acidiferrimicrobium australe]